MIDKRPAPGDLSDWVMTPYEDRSGDIQPAIFDRPSERVSALLGPDGEPLLVGIPRRAIGFDLRPSEKRTAHDQPL